MQGGSEDRVTRPQLEAVTPSSPHHVSQVFRHASTAGFTTALFFSFPASSLPPQLGRAELPSQHRLCFVNLYIFAWGLSFFQNLMLSISQCISLTKVNNMKKCRLTSFHFLAPFSAYSCTESCFR